MLKLPLKRFDGAGVLYWVKNPAGKKEILLALRKLVLHKKTWSIPGGGLESQDGDLMRCVAWGQARSNHRRQRLGRRPPLANLIF
jgi:8-oxo-dGTP pyrophosphatase MutT (NUDIX family)